MQYQQLADAVRLAAWFRWNEGVRNHFSVQEGEQIAVQCEDVPWERMTAQDLVVFPVGKAKAVTANVPRGIGVSAFHVHRALHEALGPRATCVLHLHSPCATAVSCLADPRLPNIHQNVAYFHGKVAYAAYPDSGTESGTTEAQVALSAVLGLFADPNIRVVLQANHGVLVIGESVPAAFDDLFYFENACSIYLRALGTRQPLRCLSDAVCERIARDRDRDREEYGRRHMDVLLRGLTGINFGKL